MDAPIVELVKDFRFEAAHYLPNVGAGHKCRRMHGHSFRGEVAVPGPIDPRVRWPIDFAALQPVIHPVLVRLHYYPLNEVYGLDNPPSVRKPPAIWHKIRPRSVAVEAPLPQTTGYGHLRPPAACGLRPVAVAGT